MARYAVVKDNNILNIIEAEESAFGILPILVPDANDFILIAENEAVYPGGDIINGKFRNPRPFPSWVWNENDWEWNSPIPYPDDFSNPYRWNEDLLEWEIVDRPIEHPIAVIMVNEDGSENQYFIDPEDNK